MAIFLVGVSEMDEVSVRLICCEEVSRFPCAFILFISRLNKPDSSRFNFLHTIFFSLFFGLRKIFSRNFSSFFCFAIRSRVVGGEFEQFPSRLKRLKADRVVNKLATFSSPPTQKLFKVFMITISPQS